MISRTFILFLFLVGSALIIGAQEPAWFDKLKNVKLLSDTHADIIDKFGPLKKTGYSPRIEQYPMKTGNLSVLFTVTKCDRSPGREDHIRWSVPENTVEEVRFYFSYDSKVPASYLRLDLTDFERFDPYGGSGKGEYVGYVNYEKGFSYIVTITGFMKEIAYFPTRIQKSKLLCTDNTELF